MSATRLVAPDGDGVAVSRVRFLTAEPVEPGRVRGSILASWRRSKGQRVVADHVQLDEQVTPDVDSPLTRSAEPVLLELRERLDGQPVSIILTDQTGLVLRRLTGDHDLERGLDRVWLAPGFSYAEKYVGTNGIGTALEVGGPAQVFGHEHYAENLEQFGCAGVPIRHPLSGRTVGALDLTCWRKDAGPLLLALAKTTAEQIRQALLTEAGGGQLALFQEYLRTCRRQAGAVFALDGDAVMMNGYAHSMLDPADQAALLEHATAAVSAGRRWAVDVDLPTGLTARLHCRPVAGAGPTAGVVHVRVGSRPTLAPKAWPVAPRAPLIGLVGSAPRWLRACDAVDLVLRAGEWLALEGEPGVGKMALLRAMHARHQLTGRLVVLDAADAASNPRWLDAVGAALAEDARHVVIRHVDQLDSRRLRRLTTLLEPARAKERVRPPWVGVTLAGGDQEPLDRLLRLFPSSVEVPPLRLHSEDLPQLVDHLLGRLGTGDRLSCSPEALQLLLRASWPGNIEQLQQTLRVVVRHRRTGVIRPEDLPPDARTVSRRRLTPLESIERDAIMQSLGDAHGDKGVAARSLGMSRATIYRKLRSYGIVDPTR